MMTRFIIRRSFTALLSLVVVTMLIFGISRFYGDPMALYVPAEGYGLSVEEQAKVRARLHLDKPFPVQYAYWLGNLLSGDLGTDLEDRQPLGPKLQKRILPTLMLAGLAWVIGGGIGIPLGVLSAIKRGSIWDFLGRGFAVLGHSVPQFWVGMVGILVFSVWLGLLPSGTMGIYGTSWRNFVLPVAVLGWSPMAAYLRLTRSAMLEILDSEYVTFARAKGVRPIAVIWKHSFRNALIPPLTLSGLQLAVLITGSVAVETVFAWPGIGRWAVQAVWTNNFNVLALVTLVFSAGFAVMSFLVDILYGVVDPRIRYE